MHASERGADARPWLIRLGVPTPRPSPATPTCQPGLPALVDWLGQLQHTVHHRERDSFSLMVTTGSQDALAMVRAWTGRA